MNNNDKLQSVDYTIKFSGKIDFEKLQKLLREEPLDFDCIYINQNKEVGPDEWDSLIGKYNGKVEDLLSKNTPNKYYESNWIPEDSMVYPFDPEKQIIPSFEIPSDWKRIRTISFGFINPFICQWWAISPSNNLFLYREIYKTQKPSTEHALDIIRLSEGEKIDFTLTNASNIEDICRLRNAGIENIQYPYHPILKSIKLTQKRFKPEEEEPSILFFKNTLVEVDFLLKEENKAKQLIDEFKGYKWQKDKEYPIFTQNNGIQAMERLILSLDKKE